MKRAVLTIALLAAAQANDTNSSAIDEAKNVEPRENLEPIEVVDKRRDDLRLNSLTNPYRLNQSQIAGSEIFTAEDIKNLQPKDLWDLLDKATGVDVTHWGRRHPFSVNLRGGGSLVYVLNGAVLPPDMTKLLQKIPVDMIEELQIVRGASALNLAPLIKTGQMNGSTSGSTTGAIGGVAVGYVLIRVKRPENQSTVLRASVEMYDEKNTLSYKGSAWTGDTFETESGVKGYIAGMIGGYDRPKINDDWFDGSRAFAESLSFGAAYEKVEANLLVYNDEGYFEMQRGKEDNGTQGTARWFLDPIKTTLWSFDAKVKWSEAQTTIFDLYHSRYEQTEFIGGNRTFANPYPANNANHVVSNTGGYGLRHNLRLESDTLLNASYQSIETKTKDFENYRTGVTGWSLGAEQALFDDALSFDIGYRQDQKRIFYDKASAIAAARMKNKDLPAAKVWAIGLNARPIKAVDLSARYFQSDQGTHSDLDIKSASGKLSAEKQKRYELSLGVTPIAAFNAQIAYFAIEAKNEKSATSATYGCGGDICFYYNQADAKRDGIEAIVSGAIGGSSTYKLSWTHMLNDKRDGEKQLGDMRPRDLLSIAATHDYENWRFNLSGKWVSAYSASSAGGMGMGSSYWGDLRLGDYTRVDFNTIYAFKFGEDNSGDVTLYGRNIGDKQYATRYHPQGGGYFYDRGRVVGVEVALKY
ncbi:MAG: TonB-dependent receptor plug domain-containing protein [Helicobacteraceae bacterium]|jgi:iron complex outermembrane receptor protein|nr:TonB-dependent receptor plug domain-containing protein [Helicobacteraceae bacterium]